jgi:hypothetical protein
MRWKKKAVSKGYHLLELTMGYQLRPPTVTAGDGLFAAAPPFLSFKSTNYYGIIDLLFSTK